jgi:hypothetical protein
MSFCEKGHTATALQHKEAQGQHNKAQGLHSAAQGQHKAVLYELYKALTTDTRFMATCRQAHGQKMTSSMCKQAHSSH